MPAERTTMRQVREVLRLRSGADFLPVQNGPEIVGLRIPGEVARESAMMSPSIPISCRPAFRDDVARHSGMMSLS